MDPRDKPGGINVCWGRGALPVFNPPPWRPAAPPLKTAAPNWGGGPSRVVLRGWGVSLYWGRNPELLAALAPAEYSRAAPAATAGD
jgi:hypothetical protein